jgi:hypothetical protein
MTSPRIPTVTFLVGPDKVSPATRYQRGVAIASAAPASQLYNTVPDVKTATDTVTQSNTTLKTAIDAQTNAAGKLQLARASLAQALVAWDAAYDVFVATGERYASTPSDAHGLGAVALGRTVNSLAPPRSIKVVFDAKNDRLRIHVARAPGMTAVHVQISPDPVTATSWSDLPGAGAVHIVPTPAKGTWWVRACSVTASAASAFTSPASAIVT